jgi:hypothetical protein
MRDGTDCGSGSRGGGRRVRGWFSTTVVLEKLKSTNDWMIDSKLGPGIANAWINNS